MRSGNLNFTIPLLKVKGRGWNVPFNLSYNSQNWRHDSGGTWNLGRDRGYGYGWSPGAAPQARHHHCKEFRKFLCL